MKRIICTIAMALCLCLCLTACQTSMSYTFNIETGDSVKVKLNTTDGYKLSQEGGRFFVSKDDTTILQGIFLLGEAYPAYEEAVKTDATILESDDDFYFYTIDGEAGTEHNFLLMIPDSDTALILASTSGEEAARTAFDLLTFEVNGD